MRKNLLFGLLFFIAISAGCNRNDTITDSSRVVLEAYQSSSRVSFDGVKSSWEDGDCLNVVVDGLANHIFSHFPPLRHL